jgi:hypothetical protein
VDEFDPAEEQEDQPWAGETHEQDEALDLPASELEPSFAPLPEVRVAEPSTDGEEDNDARE